MTQILAIVAEDKIIMILVSVYRYRYALIHLILPNNSAMWKFMTHEHDIWHRGFLPAAELSLFLNCNIPFFNGRSSAVKKGEYCFSVIVVASQPVVE